MDRPAQYAGTNEQQRRYTLEVIQELGKYFNWKENIGDTLLDVGCGPGDVMVDFVVPLLGQNYTKIVECDASEAMVKYATDVYSTKNSKIQFQLLDIAEENLQIVEQFNHVTSFWCLNWVQHRQRLAVMNMFNLIKPGGDIMLEFAANSPFCATYENLFETCKWRHYLTDIDRFIYPQQYSENPAKEFKTILREAGLQEIYCETRELMFIYKGFQDFRHIFQAFNIFEKNIPPFLRDDFYKEYFDEIKKQPEVVTENKAEEIIRVPIVILIVYAKKPAQELTPSC